MTFAGPIALQAVAKRAAEQTYRTASEIASPELASQALQEVRQGKYTFFNLPMEQFVCAFEIALQCNEEEFDELYNAFKLRVTPRFYDVGFFAFENHCTNDYVLQLFSLLLRVVNRLKRKFYNRSVFSIIGDDFKQVGNRFYNYLIREELTPYEFIDRYSIDINSELARDLCVNYIAKCDVDQIHDCDDILPFAIEKCNVELLRVAIRNYTYFVDFESIPIKISEAIYLRLMREDKDENLGLTRKNLELMRSIKFKKIFDSLFKERNSIYKLYCELAGNITKVKELEQNYFIVTFEKYVILNNNMWDNIAYAFSKEKYKECYKEWKNAGFTTSFWQDVLAQGHSNAHDIILGIQKSDVIQLNFEGFDRLYAKDVMTKL